MICARRLAGACTITETRPYVTILRSPPRGLFEDAPPNATTHPVFSISVCGSGSPALACGQPTKVEKPGLPTIGLRFFGPTHHCPSRCSPLPHPQSPGTPTSTPPYDSQRQPSGRVGDTVPAGSTPGDRSCGDGLST